MNTCSMPTELRTAGAKSGFTLVEILLVVAILGILASIAAVSLSHRTGDANKTACRVSIQAFQTAIDAYDVDNGIYPASLQSLVTRGTESNWRGPYMRDGKLPQDPWGHDFVYTPREGGFEIRSAGPDGQLNTADDITS